MVDKFFKAIETKYNGYKFRSRLEARWAVFFDTLNIEYQYEPEGYSLEGTPYLPDFYLPKQDCFVEIKGQEPTDEEMEKTKLLAIYTGKTVYTHYGNIGLPGQPGNYFTLVDHPPHIYTYPEEKRLGQEPTLEVDVPRIVLVILQKLEENDLEAEIKLYLKTYPVLMLRPKRRRSYHVYEIQDYILELQKQSQNLAKLAPLIEQHENAIVEALTPQEGWKKEFFSHSPGPNFAWHECLACGDLKIDVHYTVKGRLPHDCETTKQAIYVDDSPHLVAAYTAAREARF